VDALAGCPERGRFVRGLRAYAGFQQVGVPVERAERHAGRSKYTLRKLVALAADGMIGFSSAPLRLVGWAGGLMLLTALALAIGAAIRASAWLGMAGVVLFAAGVQLVALGVVGAYIQRIFWEVKGRPAYVIREMRGPMTSVRRAA
jgi:polyisoprenyl-phosphate glycosyltransferase